MDEQALVELREKYVRLGELKRLPRTSDAAAWKASLRDLAARFPGALKELEKLSLAEVDRRAAAVAEVIATRDLLPLLADDPARRWMVYAIRFHAVLRALLRAKRAAGPTRGVALSEVQTRLSRAGETLAPSMTALLVDPPDGRLSHAAYRILATELSVDEQEIHAAVFPGVPYHRR